MKFLKGLSTVLLWVLVLLSFTANAFLLRLLLDARAQAGEAVRLGAQAVSDVQAGAIVYTLRIDREVPVQAVLPAGTELPLANGAVLLSEDVPVETTARLAVDIPVEIKMADTPLNASLLSTKDFLDRLYAQWQRDPLQAFLAPLP